jgi:hypothetical protein
VSRSHVREENLGAPWPLNASISPDGPQATCDTVKPALVLNVVGEVQYPGLVVGCPDLDMPQANLGPSGVH